MPSGYRRDSLLGGHAVTIVGYNDLLKNGNTTGYFVVQNSWGTSWGVHGLFYLPYSYVTNKNLTTELSYMIL